MSHTLGIICQHGTVHLPDSCPGRGCSGSHGYGQIECPTPEACKEFAARCSVCTPQAVEGAGEHMALDPVHIHPPKALEAGS